MIRIGIDIGGTFTDFVIWRSAAGGEAIHTFKLSSTPPRFHDAVIQGLEKLLAEKVIDSSDEIVAVHGTTVSTNTIIERTGADLALIVTKGFRDLLNIQRLRLDKATDFFNARAVPLIPRERVFPADERLDASGRVLTALDPAEIEAIGEQIRAKGIENVVVSFLHSYRNAEHENRVAGILARACPELTVTLGSAIWPQQAEYERSVVAVLNAYVKRKIAGYVEEIETYLRKTFRNARLYITRSNGGVMSAREACAVPVHTLLSGPASGVSASVYMAKWRSERAFLTMDMGGTSTDLSLVLDGEPLVSSSGTVGDFPLYMPMTSIEAIGAGGGSIAAIDGPVLTVGPRSAGAQPGPACYGRGGKEPTLTDAYLLCGYIDPKSFLGGRMKLHPDLAENAMQPVASSLGKDASHAAEACVNVTTSNMIAKVLPFLARVGADPRSVTLLAYGGAGPLHACFLAEEIGIERVVVPAMPSVFCAYGGTVSPLIHDMNRTIQGLGLAGEGLAAVFAELGAAARDWLGQQIDPALLESSETQWSVEARYLGQSFNVTVPVPADVAGKGEVAAIEAAFHREHEKLYAHADSHAPVELVQARVRILGHMQMPEAGLRVLRLEKPEQQQPTRRCLFDGAWVQTKATTVDALNGQSEKGPVIIEGGDTTIVVPPGWRASLETGVIEILRRS
ncbi:MAG: hydantoinase/oxoprolinase family protein [Alphaproteobacteria bacterium]|nr:hydantoinase/oxoprolinase family protein [Alphaproteobacteria bacterium]